MPFEELVIETVKSLREVQEKLGETQGGDIALRSAVGRAALELEGSLAGDPTRRSWKDFSILGEEVSLEGPAASTFESALERFIDESDLLPVSFLEQGVEAQRSVARIVLTRPHEGFPTGTGWATGFLVAPSLFLTNEHAIPDAAFSQNVRFQFNFQLGPDGVERESDSYVASEVVAIEESLDYALVRLASKPMLDGVEVRQIQAGQRWGFTPLNPSPIFRAGQHFNVVQHPRGRRKEIALQDNQISKLFTNVVLYTSDTEPGSSGSPVFDNLWQLVALHHAGGEQSPTGKWLNNEGIRIDRIVDDLRSRLDDTVQAELGI